MVEILAHLSPGHFVGEMSFLTGKDTSADVETTMPTKVLSWSITDLEEIMNNETEIKSALQYSISEDLIRKLKHS